MGIGYITGVMGFDVPHITMSEVAMASGLFSSKSDLRRTASQNGVSINGVRMEPDDMNDLFEVGDFINLFMDGRGSWLADSFGTKQLVLVERGKRKKILMRVDTNGTEVLN